jgi:DNA-binding transcriptional LysR family regulator
MDLRDIEVFVQVVEDGDFSAAARTLALTPSTVSKSIARLENHLGRRRERRKIGGAGYSQLFVAEVQPCFEMARTACTPNLSALPTVAGRATGRIDQFPGPVILLLFAVARFRNSYDQRDEHRNPAGEFQHLENRQAPTPVHGSVSFRRSDRTELLGDHPPCRRSPRYTMNVNKPKCY